MRSRLWWIVCAVLAQLVFAQCMYSQTNAVNLESMFGSAVSGVSSAVSQVNGAVSTVASDVGKGVSSFTAHKKSTMPSSSSPSAAVTVSATNPSQKYNKAIGTLLTYGASASLLSQYASSNGGSSFLASVSSSVSKSNTVHQFNIQGSSVGTTAGAAVTTSTGSDYGTKPNAAPAVVPMAGCVLYFSILVGIVGAGVVFL